MSFSFGSAPKTAASGFTLPTNPTSTNPTTASGFQFTPSSGAGAGDTKQQNKPSAGLFGSLAGNTIGGPSFGAKTTAPGLNFSMPPASSAPSFSLGPAATTTTTVTSTPQFSFGSTTTAASAASFTPILASASDYSYHSAAPVSTAAPKYSFGLATITSTATTTSSAALTVGSTTLTPVRKLENVNTKPTIFLLLSYRMLHRCDSSMGKEKKSSNKCNTYHNINLECWSLNVHPIWKSKENFFTNQAKQLNAWDSLLISNGEKILHLSNIIERVKQQQQQLNQALDFVLAQQKELEESIVPLEKELAELPVTDIDRNQMYQFCEIIDSQMKQMSDDLKEIVEHINESNKSEEASNPVTQVAGILNAHMNSLQWIDRNTAQISSQLEEINKLQDSNRKYFPLNVSLSSYSNLNNSMNISYCNLKPKIGPSAK
ncbi:hypothetical protein NQ317_002205 [Molorchus minor]|uniref:Nucleoporin NSP1-like C-terminal domain-containing protein n=1 Tax=Molorchus minor TaxID=1323400 RepID=A0ABQ9JN17_9CUCU|nr:hypothetical protein NQ317_002205 [Molorchus minor]